FALRPPPAPPLFPSTRSSDLLPEGQLRQFLAHHGIQPRAGEQPEEEPTEAPPVDPHAEVLRLRAAVQAEPDKDELKLDLALALLDRKSTRLNSSHVKISYAVF